jgi:hypothetical protein
LTSTVSDALGEPLLLQIGALTVVPSTTAAAALPGAV